MNHADHVALLREGVPDQRDDSGAVWADFGAGAGAFTLALAELLGPGGEIYAVDRDERALRHAVAALRARFPDTAVHPLVADFARPLDLPPLDGIVMANALHFVAEQDAVLRLALRYLRPGGRLLLVEYNTDRGNPWVPHPLSSPTWGALARRNGFAETRLLASRPSRFLGEIYSALSVRAAPPESDP